MALHCILVESDEKIQVVTMRIHLFFPDPDPKPNVTSADNRLIAVVGADMEAETGDALRQGIPALVEPVARRAPDSDRKLTPHVTLLAGTSAPPDAFPASLALQPSKRPI
jgi:hypothetical protein